MFSDDIRHVLEISTTAIFSLHKIAGSKSKNSMAKYILVLSILSLLNSFLFYYYDLVVSKITIGRFQFDTMNVAWSLRRISEVLFISGMCMINSCLFRRIYGLCRIPLIYLVFEKENFSILRIVYGVELVLCSLLLCVDYVMGVKFIKNCIFIIPSLVSFSMVTYLVDLMNLSYDPQQNMVIDTVSQFLLVLLLLLTIDSVCYENKSAVITLKDPQVVFNQEEEKLSEIIEFSQ